MHAVTYLSPFARESHQFMCFTQCWRAGRLDLCDSVWMES